MPVFFHALNPFSTTSGVTFRATRRPYLEIMMKDLTLDTIIPLLWQRNLSVFDGVYETFRVFYGDHFDNNGVGVGQKGLLDVAILPLFSRKLIADTYLEKRKHTYISNALAWIVALPIKALTFGVAFLCTLAMIPIIILVTVVRYLYVSCKRAVSSRPALSLPLSCAALDTALHYLRRAGIYNNDNISRLLDDPQNLLLVHVMARMTHVTRGERSKVLDNQAGFDHLLKNRAFWTDPRIIARLDGLEPINQPLVLLTDLVELCGVLIDDIVETLDKDPMLYCENNTTKSAIRLEEWTKKPSNTDIKIDKPVAQRIKNSDKKKFGPFTDQEILENVQSVVSRLKRSAYCDPRSNLCLKLLLDYCWVGAQEPQQWRDGVTEETALVCFYATLHDIGAQNMSERDAFSHMIQGMASIHRLCEVDLISPDTGVLKLQSVDDNHRGLCLRV